MKRPVTFVIGIACGLVGALIAPLMIMLVGYGICRGIAWARDDPGQMEYMWAFYVVALFAMPAGFVLTLIPFIRKLNRLEKADQTDLRR